MGMGVASPSTTHASPQVSGTAAVLRSEMASGAPRSRISPPPPGPPTTSVCPRSAGEWNPGCTREPSTSGEVRTAVNAWNAAGGLTRVCMAYSRVCSHTAGHPAASAERTADRPYRKEPEATRASSVSWFMRIETSGAALAMAILSSVDRAGESRGLPAAGEGGGQPAGGDHTPAGTAPPMRSGTRLVFGGNTVPHVPWLSLQLAFRSYDTLRVAAPVRSIRIPDPNDFSITVPVSTVSEANIRNTFSTGTISSSLLPNSGNAASGAYVPSLWSWEIPQENGLLVLLTTEMAPAGPPLVSRPVPVGELTVSRSPSAAS